MHHFDLYRLAGPNDMGRLGMDEAFDSGVCLIEWAERLEAQTPEAHLGVHLALLSKVCAMSSPCCMHGMHPPPIFVCKTSRWLPRAAHMHVCVPCMQP